MTMPQADDTPETAAARARLDELFGLLGGGEAFNPELRRYLGELAAQLRLALDDGSMPPAEVQRLADAAVHVVEGVRRRHEEGVLGRARDRLEEAVVATEARHPVVSGLALRLIDALANIGI